MKIDLFTVKLNDEGNSQICEFPLKLNSFQFDANAWNCFYCKEWYPSESFLWCYNTFTACLPLLPSKWNPHMVPYKHVDFFQSYTLRLVREIPLNLVPTAGLVVSVLNCRSISSVNLQKIPFFYFSWLRHLKSVHEW